MTAAVRSRAGGATPYIVGPIFDILFVCGGAAVLLICLGRLLGQESLAPLLFAGTYLLSQPHLGATLQRLYGSRQSVRKHPVLTVYLPFGMTVSTVACAHTMNMNNLLSGLSAVYMILIGHHVLAQSYGISLMYCGRAGFVMSDLEKGLSRGILYLAVALAVLGQFTEGLKLNMPGMPGTSFSSQLVPRFVPALVWEFVLGFLGLFLLCFIAEQMRRSSENQSVMPLPAAMTMLTAIAAVVLSQVYDSAVWLFIPAFFHGSQYLAVVLAYRWKDLCLSGVDFRDGIDPLDFIGCDLQRYLALGLAVSVAVPISLHVLGICRDPGQAFTLLFLLVSLHHFAADARLWKLQRTEVRQRLL